MARYAVLRIAKVKTMGHVAGLGLRYLRALRGRRYLLSQVGPAARLPRPEASV